MIKRLLFLLFFINYSCLAANKNITVIPFVKNQIVPIIASTFTVTEIQFDQDERIRSIQNGDLAAWSIDVNKGLPNTLFLKPTITGSNTNMTVITNRHTYYFHLSSVSSQKSAVYALQFRYPSSFSKSTGINLHIPGLPQEPYVPTSYHWSYSFHGSKQIMPMHVFDDGRFTYFQLRPGQSMPALFMVDNKKGKESVVNFRREGQYLVVHSLAPQFTLRLGSDYVASIFNDRLIRGR